MNLEISALDGLPNGVRVQGDVDLQSVDGLSEFLRPLRPPVVIDASGIEFMDSSGLHVLVRLAAEADGSPGVIVRNPSRSVRRLLQMALPDGMDGLHVEFTGAGPGAAHRLSALIDSTIELHRVTRLSHRRSALLRDAARRERFRRVLIPT